MRLIENIRRLRKHLVAHIRSSRGVLSEQGNRVGLSGYNRIEDRKMADQADDLGIPMRPARPTVVGAAVPPRGVNLSQPSAEPTPAPILPRQSIDQSIGSSRDNEVEARTLIIGPEISLSGQINSCDRLIVQGRIEADLANCHYITIAETGVFNGKAAIDDADIRGRFEGDLVVRKRLMIRATGNVSGTITYGDIEIEAGGRISGTIQAQDRPNGRGTLDRPQSAMAFHRAWISGEAKDIAPSGGEA